MWGSTPTVTGIEYKQSTLIGADTPIASGVTPRSIPAAENVVADLLGVSGQSLSFGA